MKSSKWPVSMENDATGASLVSLQISIKPTNLSYHVVTLAPLVSIFRFMREISP